MPHVWIQTDSDMSDRPAWDIFVEEGEFSYQDQDVIVTDLDQTLSVKLTYRKTMRGIRSYMGSYIPDMDTPTSTSDDNPFAGLKLQPSGKVSVRMPTVSLSWLGRTLRTMKPKDTLIPVHLTRWVTTTLMSIRRKVPTARDPKSQLGRTLGNMAKAREARAGHLTTHHGRPRVNSPIHDNYCVNVPVYTGLLTRSKETVNVFQSPEI